MSPRHIIWDWNGTLLDDVDVVVGVMNTLLGRRGLPTLTPDSYRDVFGFPVRSYYEAIGFDLDREPFDVLADEWIAAFEGQWRTARLQEGALDAISTLTRAGIGQSVLSAAQQATLEAQAAHFGVDTHFERLVGIDDHHAESKLAHGRAWMAELAVDPAEVLMVGDTEHDFEVARELDIQAVLVADGHQSHERLVRCGVPVVESLEELCAPGGPVFGEARETPGATVRGRIARAT